MSVSKVCVCNKKVQHKTAASNNMEHTKFAFYNNRVQVTEERKIILRNSKATYIHKFFNTF